MENVSEMNEDITFNALKYKRYASAGIEVGDIWVSAGTTYWVNDAGKLHREDGPSLEYPDGSKFWHLNGELHREDGPAVERDDRSKCWYLNGRYIKSE